VFCLPKSVSELFGAGLSIIIFNKAKGQESLKASQKQLLEAWEVFCVNSLKNCTKENP